MGVINDVLNFVRPSRGKPQVTIDGASVPTPLRGSRYGEVVSLSMVPTLHPLADEDSYFTVANPALGTQVTYAIRAAFADTAAAFLIKNNAKSSDPTARNVYLHYARLMFTGATPVVPASAISALIAVRIDVAGKDRAPSAGAAGRGPFSPISMLGNASPDIQIWEYSGGELTLPASSSAGAGSRTVRGVMKPAIPVTQDELIAFFGVTDPGGGSIGTSAGLYRGYLAPVVLQPQETAAISIYFPGNAATAGAFEYELGMFAR